MENNSSASSGQAGSGHGSNFFSGFLLGALVGAAIVFLLGTKKGKRILKAISEEGAENISNILDKIDKSVVLPDESLENEEPSLSKASTFTDTSADKSAGKGLTGKEKNPVGENKPKIKRFFKGISKRLN